jgi:hypothetical protein
MDVHKLDISLLIRHIRSQGVKLNRTQDPGSLDMGKGEPLCTL